jgi:ketosteroid isomerase-like protein
MRYAIRTILAATLAASAGLASQAAAAQALTVEQARAVIAPFYDALNAAPGKDVAALITRATSADWVSCGGNEACSPRDKVIGNIAGFGKAIPDLKWEIKEVLVAGDRAIVRGEASGTPAGAFMGVPHGGKSFRVMSIDVHTVRDGRIVRSYHVEDWMGATRQLAAK